MTEESIKIILSNYGIDLNKIMFYPKADILYSINHYKECGDN